MGELRSCLDSGRARDAVAADLAKGAALGVQGTPTFYINGRAYDGQVTGEALAAAIQAELDAA